MPNIKANVKSLRQDKKKHVHNKPILAELRTISKNARVSIKSANREEADTILKTLESKLDRAAKRNIIKKNNASRHIARLRSQWSKLASKA